MTRWLRPLLPLLLFLLSLAPQARAQDLTPLLQRLEAAGVSVVRVAPNDARLRDGRVTTSLNAAGQVEVFLPEGGAPVRTPLSTPTERLSVDEFRRLSQEMREAVRRVYGIEVERVYIAGSSSGIPFHAPNGEVRTFDRRGPMTSDYDGALVSRELFERVEAERPRAIRGRTTGLRTAPDPLPALQAEFDRLSQRWGRHIAGMVYASEAEFQKRMTLTELTVGRHVMPEPPANATHVEVTRAELVRALLEAEQLQRLAQARGVQGAQNLLDLARSGDPAAQETVRRARAAASQALLQHPPAALTEVDRATLTNELNRLSPPQEFSPRRSGPRAPPEVLLASEATAREVFERIRSAALERSAERLAELPPAERAAFAEARSRAAVTGLEILPSSELRLEFNPETNTVRVSTGLLNRVELARPAAEAAEFRRTSLGLLFGHELAHATGIRAEAVADAEASRYLSRAYTTPAGVPRAVRAQDVRDTVRLFTRTGNVVADAVYALSNLHRHGTEAGRAEAFRRAFAGGADPLASYRRADGTLEWRRVAADRALQHGAGVAHFALALFLKELAVVARTGDRLRIEEFFEGLATTDFFVTYGLFSAGAHVGNVAYSRYLQRFVKPQFLSGILRTNLVLATGLALPEIVRGHFEGRAFAINLGSLGLSATAVKVGLQGIRWVVDLRRARTASAALTAGARLGRLARFGGWFYTAAETAVVLYFGEQIAELVTEHLDERAARQAVGDATAAAFTAVATRADLDTFLTALDAVSAQHAAYRNHLLAPLTASEAQFHTRLERFARDAKLLADRREELLARLENPLYRAVRAHAVRSAGSVDAYVEARLAAEAAEVDASIEEAMRVYQRDREAFLDHLYAQDRRAGPLFTHDTTRVQAADAPTLGRQARSRLSSNRLQAYDDELETLTALRRAAADDVDRAAAVDRALTLARRTAELDARLFQGDDAPPESDGIIEALQPRDD